MMASRLAGELAWHAWATCRSCPAAPPAAPNPPPAPQALMVALVLCPSLPLPPPPFPFTHPSPSPTPPPSPTLCCPHQALVLALVLGSLWLRSAWATRCVAVLVGALAVRCHLKPAEVERIIAAAGECGWMGGWVGALQHRLTNPNLPASIAHLTHLSFPCRALHHVGQEACKPHERGCY